jgi:uncharacterized MAPEG superfamily protein
MNLQDPNTSAFAVTTLLLCAHLLLVWAYSGVARVRSKKIINPEDAVVAKGAELDTANPEFVARVLRAHTNAMATIVPFLFLALLFVLLGGPFAIARIVFPFFAVTRVLHAWAYIGEKQPWRTIVFALGLLAPLALIACNVWLLTR